mmetsp:Transcript_26157/g.57615  ORF Transcript_26157/g.57615 Transcript_26157/m.57615 type:complete len:87 (-) Transcript_26157:485-745(-)
MDPNGMRGIVTDAIFDVVAFGKITGDSHVDALQRRPGGMGESEITKSPACAYNWMANNNNNINNDDHSSNKRNNQRYVHIRVFFSF